MAKLSSEDQELKSSFEINLKDRINDEWLNYEIVFKVGEEIYKFKSIEDNVVGQFVFALKPKDRLEMFIQYLEKFIVNPEQKELIFEPADPSFELILKRAHGGIQAYLWVDNGNTTQLRYTWDARGLRFLTNEIKLKSFLAELKKESQTKVSS